MVTQKQEMPKASSKPRLKFGLSERVKYRYLDTRTGQYKNGRGVIVGFAGGDWYWVELPTGVNKVMREPELRKDS